MQCGFGAGRVDVQQQQKVATVGPRCESGSSFGKSGRKQQNRGRSDAQFARAIKHRDNDVGKQKVQEQEKQKGKTYPLTPFLDCSSATDVIFVFELMSDTGVVMTAIRV